MGITLRPVQIETGSSDHESMLVFDENRLLAILVCLSELHESDAGVWHLEYGPIFGKNPGTFASLEQAASWIEAQIALRPEPSSG